MTSEYKPGPAAGAKIEKEGDEWTLVLTRELHHPPEKVWKAITEPAHLKKWAPFDADANLGKAGATITLTTVGTPQISETTISRADAPKLLE